MIKVIIEFQSYWQISTGRGAGHFMDSLIDTDHNDLPYVPGKTFKGLFRDAVERVEHWQQQSNEQTQRLFGTSTGIENRNTTEPGCLNFSSLALPQEEVAQLNQNPHLKSLLTTSVSSTKIDHQTGVAEDKSLRTQQVAIPLRLEGEIALNANANQSMDDVFTVLQQASAFITHIGAKKSRGFGQVKCQLILQKGGQA